MSTFDDDLIDSFSVRESFQFSLALQRAETIAFTEAWTIDFLPGNNTVETIKFSDSYTLNFIRNEAVQETVHFTATPTIALALQLISGFSITDSLVPVINHLYSFTFKVTDSVSASVIYNVSVQDMLKLIDSARILAGAYVTDTFHTTDHAAYQYVAQAALQELLTITATVTPVLVMQVSIPETINFNDEYLLNFIYNVGLDETFTLDITNQEPGETVTTWAINTRTQAVTQYTNWDFNSFATMGRKYIAAGPEGLYELNGARDGTTNIIADLAGAFFQPADGRLAGLKGVYLGVKGQGKGSGATWMLKLETGDGRTYIYQRVSNPNLMTTKIDVGKGLRSTYFAWELISSDGQDFDLDTITFVPMISGRRIG